jgi:hypothetical protein
MPLHQIANLVIDSSIALRSVPSARTGGGAWRFVVDRRGVPPGHPVWYHHEKVQGGARFRSLAREGESHVIRFWRRASFLLSFETRRITCYPCRSASLETVQQLLVGHVIPLVFADEGALALHASAVLAPQGVLAFVAETGGGKSTIASALGARGCSIVADDCAIVDVDEGGCRVRPMDVGLRLWPDTVGMLRGSRSRATRRAEPGVRKKRFAAQALGMTTHCRSEPLRRVYLLQASRGARGPTIDRASCADAVVALMLASFQLGIDEPERLRQAFERLSTLVTTVPVLRLSSPPGLQHLPAVVDAVLENAAGQSSIPGVHSA